MKSKKNTKTMLKNNFYMFKMVWRIKPSRILFTIFINLVNGSLNFISQIFLLRYIINAATNKASFESVLIVASVVLLYQIFGMSINTYYNAIFCPTCDNIIKQNFQKELFNKALSIDLIEYDNPDFYDKYVRAISESNGRALQIVNLFGRLVNCLFVLVSVSLIIFTLEPLLIFIAILPFVFNMLVGSKRNKINYKQNMEFTMPNRIRDYVRRVVYFNNYAKEIRLTNIFKVLKKKFDSAIEQCIEITRRYSTKNILLGIIMPLINQVVVYLGTITYTSYRTIVKKSLPLADAFVIIRSIWQVSSSLNDLSNIFVEFHNHSLYVNNINVFMTYIPTIKNSADSIPLKGFDDKIQINDISFKYPDDDNFVLKNVSFTIRKGEKIAIVGHNGAGKTTLIKLLLRLYDPMEGYIELDNINIKNYNVDDYRIMFSTVFQDYKIFALSILDNILCGNQADDETISESLFVSGLSSKIQNIEQGVNANLTKEFDENGEVFSGGEQQKLALARAFAKNTPIIVLDEPSSALDPIAEYEMFENMMKVCEDKTVIYISHRLSSVVLSDRILMMENGDIVEEGTHKELMSKGGKYADLFSKQAEHYVKEGE